MSDGFRTRGEEGVPRMASTKLDRCEACGLGMELILSAGGGGERPKDDVELLRDCDGEVLIGSGAPFFTFAGTVLSAIIEDVGGVRGVTEKVRGERWISLNFWGQSL